MSQNYRTPTASYAQSVVTTMFDVHAMRSQFGIVLELGNVLHLNICNGTVLLIRNALREYFAKARTYDRFVMCDKRRPERPCITNTVQIR